MPARESAKFVRKPKTDAFLPGPTRKGRPKFPRLAWKAQGFGCSALAPFLQFQLLAMSLRHSVTKATPTPLLSKDERFIRLVKESQETVRSYFEEQRQSIDNFCLLHFSFQGTWKRFRRALGWDLVRLPINSALSIPYLTFKKSLSALDKIGWDGPARWVEKVPSGLKTNVQKEMEYLIVEEILRPRGDETALESQLKKSFGRFEESNRSLISLSRKSQELKNYFQSYATLTDFSGLLATLAVGYYFFRDMSLGILEMGNRWAHSEAKSEAASNFILGAKLGRGFYNIFPPEVSNLTVFKATLSIAIVCTLLTWTVNLVLDPIQFYLGLHQRRLKRVIDQLEENTSLECYRRALESARSKLSK